MIYTNEITVTAAGGYVELTLAGNEYIVLREDLIHAGKRAGFTDAPTAQEIIDEKSNRMWRDEKTRKMATSLLNRIKCGAVTRKNAERTLQEIIDNMGTLL